MTRREFSPSSTSSALLLPIRRRTQKNRKVFITFNRLLIYLNVSFMCFHVDCVFSLSPPSNSLYCSKLSLFSSYTNFLTFASEICVATELFIFSPSQENHFSRLLLAAAEKTFPLLPSVYLFSLSLYVSKKNHFNFCCSMLIAIYSMLPIFFGVHLHLFGTIECHSIFISFAIPPHLLSHTLFRLNIVCSRCRKFPIIWIFHTAVTM